MAGISPAVLGTVIVLNNINNQPEVSCKLVVPEGLSAKGLECVVQPIHQLSGVQSAMIVGGILLLFSIVALFFVYQDRKIDRRFYKQYGITSEKKKSRFRK